MKSNAHFSRVVIVTGAGSGIGRGIAVAFGLAGYNVVVADVDSHGGNETVGLMMSPKQLGSTLFVPVDVTDEHSVTMLMNEVDERWGRLDVLVNNAGVSFKKSFYEMTVSEWDRVLAVNLKGVFLCSKHAVPLMRKTGRGSIVNVSSIDSLRSLPRISAYAASKGGVNALTQTMAMDVAEYSIRVNAVLPGFIQTAIWDEWLESLSPDERNQAIREVLAALALKRIGTPKDVAEAVIFLASDSASYITGSSLIVDGGLTARAYVVSSDEKTTHGGSPR